MPAPSEPMCMSAKHSFLVATAVILASFFVACGALTLNPVADEARLVHSVADAAKTVNIPAGMVWYDGPRGQQGLRFPPGRYQLEAEDADYWYFRSPAPLELRTFASTGAASRQDIAGGLMIAKHFSMVPGAGYAEGSGSTKVMVWKLGQDFLAQEGKSWIKSF